MESSERKIGKNSERERELRVTWNEITHEREKVVEFADGKYGKSVLSSTMEKGEYQQT